MQEIGVAVERDPFGTPRDPSLAQAEREGRLTTSKLRLAAADGEVRDLQAEGEGAASGDVVEFCGEKFTIGERIGLMPLLKFAYVSSKGVSSDDMQGLAAMYSMIKDCIAPGEWDRFEEHAINSHADDEDLLDVVSKTIEILTARPTKRRSDSSAGSPSTSESSKASSIRQAPEGLTPLSS